MGGDADAAGKFEKKGNAVSQVDNLMTLVWKVREAKGEVELNVALSDLKKELNSTLEAALKTGIQWPKARDVGRYGDMSREAHIRVGLDTDSDVYVSVWDGEGGATVEFCTPSLGGGKSSETRAALIALMVAMEKDNAARPSLDWWARRNGVVNAAPPAQTPPKQCAQCGRDYKQCSSEGCPKCAPGLTVSEAEFKQPITPSLTTCDCRWDGDKQVQQCTLHEAHVNAIHEWAERARSAEAKLKERTLPPRLADYEVLLAIRRGSK
jgi:hypothetical protein